MPPDVREQIARVRTLLQDGRGDDARRLARRLLADADADACSNLARALLESGEPELAREACERVVALRPGAAKSHHNLALVLRRLNRPQEAAAGFERTLRIDPNHAKAMANLAGILEEARQFAQALPLYQRAAELEPDNALAYSRVARLLARLNRFDAALGYFRRAYEIDPSASNLSEVADALRNLNRHDESLAAYEAALTMEPDQPMLWSGMGIVLAELGRLEESLARHDRALELAPADAEVRFNRAWGLLRMGRLVEGLREFESKQRLKDFVQVPARTFEIPAWDGRELNGQRILLHTEHGMGDAIHFVRYAPMVAERGGEVVLSVARPLVRLLASVEGVRRVVAPEEPCQGAAFHAELMQLPIAFDTTLETIPNRVPYVHADATLLEQWRQKLGPAGGKIRVGLAWAGNPANSNDARRSCPLVEFAPLWAAGGADVEFFSLQKERAAEQLRSLPPSMPITDLGGSFTDFADAAAAIECLDLVIAVDTSLVHLAGALNKAVWVMLPFAPDWRWLSDREDSPWYPSMQLLRQDRGGRWSPVIRRAAEALRRLAGTAEGRRVR